MKVTIVNIPEVREKYFPHSDFSGQLETVSELAVCIRMAETERVIIPFSEIEKVVSTDVIELHRFLAYMHRINIVGTIEISTIEQKI